MMEGITENLTLKKMIFHLFSNNSGFILASILSINLYDIILNILHLLTTTVRQFASDSIPH